MKKILNSLFLLVYPSLLATGFWILQKVDYDAARTFRVPLTEFIIWNLCLVVSLGLFAYIFLVQDSSFFVFTAILGIASLLVFLCLGMAIFNFSGSFTALSRGTYVFEAVFIMYIALFIKEKRKRKQ